MLHDSVSPGEDRASYPTPWKAPSSFLLLPRHLWHQRQDKCQEERGPGDPRWARIKENMYSVVLQFYVESVPLFIVLSILVGYSWLPLLKEGRLSSQEFNIPVSCNLPPGYLAIKEASNTKVREEERTASFRRYKFSIVNAESQHLISFYSGDTQAVFSSCRVEQMWNGWMEEKLSSKCQPMSSPQFTLR